MTNTTHCSNCNEEMTYHPQVSICDSCDELANMADGYTEADYEVTTIEIWDLFSCSKCDETKMIHWLMSDSSILEEARACNCDKGLKPLFPNFKDTFAMITEVK